MELTPEQITAFMSSPIGGATIPGLSLRDYFAAHAPPIPYTFSAETPPSQILRETAVWNYAYADAMLKERGK